MPHMVNGVTHMLQVVMRPVQLWEIAFPEDSKNDILSLIGNDSLVPVTDDDGIKKPNTWIPWLRSYDYWFLLLRSSFSKGLGWSE